MLSYIFSFLNRDRIKTKEDILNEEDKNLRDLLQSLRSQSSISSYAIVLIVAFITLSLNNIISFGFYYKISYVFCSISLLIIGMINILPRDLGIHTNMDDTFMNSGLFRYEDYLNIKYRHLNNLYEKAKKQCNKKIIINLILYSLMLIFISINLIIAIFYG